LNALDVGSCIVIARAKADGRGVEIYRGLPINYLAVDFIDDCAVDKVEHNDRSSIFGLEVAGSGLHQMKPYPAAIRKCRTSLARRTEAEETA